MGFGTALLLSFGVVSAITLAGLALYRVALRLRSRRRVPIRKARSQDDEKSMPHAGFPRTTEIVTERDPALPDEEEPTDLVTTGVPMERAEPPVEEGRRVNVTLREEALVSPNEISQSGPRRTLQIDGGPIVELMTTDD